MLATVSALRLCLLLTTLASKTMIIVGQGKYYLLKHQ